MLDFSMLLVNLAAIVVLVVPIYFVRHRRRDLAIAFLGVNVGVFAVASALSSTEVALGLGLGLFGVLSIIRLRSSEISQREVAYYFAALAIGLISGLQPTFSAYATVLIGMLVVVLGVADHPALAARHRHRTIHLDEAITDEVLLHERLSDRLGGEIKTMSVQHIDFVNDTMLVDVRYRVGALVREPAAVAQ